LTPEPARPYAWVMSKHLAKHASAGLRAIAVIAVAAGIAAPALGETAPRPQGGSQALKNKPQTLPRDGSPPRKAETTPEQDAAERKKLVTSLLKRLGEADDVQTAQLIERGLWQLWMQSGSATIDLLMTQAVSLMNEGELNKALNILDIVVRLAPEYPEGWNKRATVLYFKEELHRSRRDIAKVLALEPRHFGAISGLGLVLQAMGDKKAALEAFRRALAIHPNLTSAREAVERLKPEVEGRGI